MHNSKKIIMSLKPVFRFKSVYEFSVLNSLTFFSNNINVYFIYKLLKYRLSLIIKNTNIIKCLNLFNSNFSARIIFISN